MEALWSQQYDAFQSSEDGYGWVWLAIPLVGGMVAGGVGGIAKRTKDESTGSRDIQRMAQAEIDKIGDPIPRFNSDRMQTGVLHGAADQGEAYAISAFWLARVSRVALYKGNSAKALQFDETARKYLRKSKLQFYTGTGEILKSQSQQAIANVFQNTARMVAPVSTGAEALLLRLADPFSTQSRKGYQEAYSYTSQIGRPAAQTLIDAGEALKAGADAVTAPFDLIAWIREHKWWIVGGIAGLTVVNALVAGGMARRSAARSTAQAPAPRRRRQYSQ